jgi:CRP-like cAMP-binding protein
LPNQETPSPVGSRALNLAWVAILSQKLELAAWSLTKKSAGGRLAAVGDTVLQLPLIVSGSVDAVIRQSADDGNEVVPVSWDAGELVLMSQLFSREPCGVDLVVTDDLVFRWLPIADIERCLLQSQELLIQFVHYLTQRLREVQSRERAWLERGVHERVCASLARIARATPPDAQGVIVIAGTHETLAGRCAVSRPRLSGELKQLEDAGRLKLSRGAIEIIDVDWFSAARW